tara:strand:+ start:237 stop:413 length:177 start_codon:yes stop_codon:yes gene_type:complete
MKEKQIMSRFRAKIQAKRQGEVIPPVVKETVAPAEVAPVVKVVKKKKKAKKKPSEASD